MSISDTQGRYGVALFRSVQGAIGAEKILEAAGIGHKLIPVPRHISSNCGFCLRFDWSDREAVERLLAEADLGVEGLLPL